MSLGNQITCVFITDRLKLFLGAIVAFIPSEKEIGNQVRERGKDAQRRKGL